MCSPRSPNSVERNVFFGELWERGESGKGERETLLVNILCNGFQRELIVDTGADVTILYKPIDGVEIEAVENRVITGVTGDQQKVIGIQRVLIQIGKAKCSHDVWIVDIKCGAQGILGIDLMKKLHLTIELGRGVIRQNGKWVARVHILEGIVDKSRLNIKKPQIIVLADSHGRFLLNILKLWLGDYYEIHDRIFPGWTALRIIEHQQDLLAQLEESDYVIVFVGSNDMIQGGPSAVVSALRSLENYSLRCSTLVYAVPKRFDLHPGNVIHREIVELNGVVRKLCEDLGWRFINVHQGVRNYDYTKQGFHLKLEGKIKIARKF